MAYLTFKDQQTISAQVGDVCQLKITEDKWENQETVYCCECNGENTYTVGRERGFECPLCKSHWEETEDYDWFKMTVRGGEYLDD